jgi:glutamate carboxypeptidase
MLRCLRAAVEIESPTNSKAGVDRMAKFFAREFRRLGGRVRILGHAKAGSSVYAEFFGGSVAALAQSNKPILILGHLDTVWNQGTLRRMPFRVRGARAYGPGILDMKSGIVQALWAVRALRALKINPSSPVRFFLNADEEASSVAFRKQILAEARRARAVLVVEPAAAGGALKTARKGVGEFRISVQGRAAHAGINPGAGASAITELARQIIHIQSFPLAYRGMTLNVGVIEGGTRSNVVPEFASAAVDVRIERPADGKAIERRMFRLQPFDPETRLEVTGGINRPPMERAQAGTLFQKARGLGPRLGMKLEEVATGGGSDGNFTAALGIPTLDGLGGVGDGAHARSEHVVIRELPRRAALLAALIATL